MIKGYYDKYIPNTDDFRECVLVIDGSIDRGKDIVTLGVKRNADVCISTFARTMIKHNCLKIVVVHNFDNMVKDAQMALRSILEKHSNTTRAILICNDMERVIEDIQSRCTKLRFESPSDKDVDVMINQICARDEMTVSTEILDIIKLMVSQDLKKVVNYLRVISVYPDTLTLDRFYGIFRIPSTEYLSKLIRSCIDGDIQSSTDIVRLLLREGTNLCDMLLVMMKLLMRYKCDINLRATYFTIITQYICVLEKDCHKVHLYGLINDMIQVTKNKDYNFDIVWDYV